MYKLFNFPSVNIITIPESQNRLDKLKNEFYSYGIYNLNINLFKKYKKNDYTITGEYAKNVADFHIGVLTSHLQSIKRWYDETNEEYAIFCEDDLSLETVNYWKFDWCTFMSSLPQNWGCLQLVVVKENGLFEHEKNFQVRNWDHWSTCCFMLKRSYAKKLLNLYYKDKIFTLDYRGIDEYKRKTSNDVTWFYPTCENILYSLIEPVYSVPLFVENVNQSSTINLFSNEYINQSAGHLLSNQQILDWWKNGGLDLNFVKYYPEVFG